MHELDAIMKTKRRHLIDSLSKEIAYFYGKYIPSDSISNNYGLTRLLITENEKPHIDFSKGRYMRELSAKPDISRYAVLEAIIKDSITEYYYNIGLAYELEEHLQNTVNKYLKELNNGIIRGDKLLRVMDETNKVLINRLSSLAEYVKSDRQANQNMVSYDLEEAKTFIEIEEDSYNNALSAFQTIDDKLSNTRQSIKKHIISHGAKGNAEIIRKTLHSFFESIAKQTAFFTEQKYIDGYRRILSTIYKGGGANV